MRLLTRIPAFALGCALTLGAAAAPEAAAQDVTGRVAMEAVVSASVTSEANNDPFLIFDAVSTIRAGRGWDVVIRPWARRLPGGDWGAEMYQLQLRYVSSTRVPVRLDAGIISSPLGLATLELRPDRNPTIGAPFYYYAPLPAFDGHFDGVRLMSGGYPLGAIVTASGARWDLRGGVTDATPAQTRSVLSRSRKPAAAQLVLGGGVTPLPGLRFGAGVARGRYRHNALAPASLPYDSDGYGVNSSSVGTPLPDESATVVNLEGEYAIGYTRLAGEWIIDRFDTTGTPAVARGFNLQAVRTLTPRWFAAGRAVHASSPVLTGPFPGRRTATSAEATLGYRVTPNFTVRGGYEAYTSFANEEWERQVAVSLVWAQRWW